ncbi:MAG: hypothetical protein H6919_13975 [Sphingomonadaceae bacterium]|nr:hypothetical protein [Sphingomonadaceae bacterium]
MADGTVRHVAMAMLDSGLTPLAIHPAGTVNLLARESAFPLDPGRLSERILQADAIHHHYPVQVDDTLFFACASAGPDSYAVAGLSPPAQAMDRAFGICCFLRPRAGKLAAPENHPAFSRPRIAGVRRSSSPRVVIMPDRGACTGCPDRRAGDACRLTHLRPPPRLRAVCMGYAARKGPVETGWCNARSPIGLICGATPSRYRLTVT